MKKHMRKSPSHKDLANTSARKSKKKVDSASPSPKGITVSEPNALPTSRIPIKSLPPPVLSQSTSLSQASSSSMESGAPPSGVWSIPLDATPSHSEARPLPSKLTFSPSDVQSPEAIVQKPVLSPKPQLPKPAESVPSRLTRLTLHINPEDDDWFPAYAFTNGAADTISPRDSVDEPQSATEAFKTLNSDFHPEQEVTMPINYDTATSRNAPQRSSQRDGLVQRSVSKGLSDSPFETHVQKSRTEPEESSEINSSPQAPFENDAKSQTQQSDLLVSPGQDLLKFAKQLRKHSEHSVAQTQDFASPDLTSDVSIPDMQPSLSKASVDQKMPLENDHNKEQSSSYRPQQESFQQASNQASQPFSPAPHVPGEYPLSPQVPEQSPHLFGQSGPSTERHIPAQPFNPYPHPQALPSPAREHPQQYQMFPHQRQPSYQQSPPSAERIERQQYQQPHYAIPSPHHIYQAPPAQQEYFPPQQGYFPPQADFRSLSPESSPIPPAIPPAIPLASKPRFTGPSSSSSELVRIASPAMYTIPEGYRSGHTRSPSRSTESPADLRTHTTSPVYRYPSRNSFQQSQTTLSGYPAPYEMWTQVPTPPLEVTHHHVHYDYNNSYFAPQPFERISSPPLSVVSRMRSRGSDIRPPSGRLEDRKFLSQERPFTEIMDNDSRQSMTPSRVAPRPQARSQILEPVGPAPKATKVTRKSSRVFSSLWGSKKSSVATNY
jgi:hypothetical protein